MIKTVSRLLCLTLALRALPASAYDVDNHELLTREAVALISRCARKDARLCDASPYVETLIELNVRQDDLLRKARLWHFPFVPAQDGCDNPCNEQCYSSDWCPYWLSFLCGMPVYRSWDPWVNHLIYRASFAREPIEVYRAAGALLHYVQDLAVPAHATPVFHPVPLWHGDEVDGYAITASNCNLQLEEPGDPCARLAQVSDLSSLLVRVRAATLCSVKTSFPLRQPAGAERNWGVFWRPTPDPQAPEFHLYGCQAFGEQDVKCSNDAFEVDAAAYTKFANARASAAILASAQLIVYLQKQIADNAVPSKDEPEVAIDRWLPSEDRLKRIAREHPQACRRLGSDLPPQQCDAATGARE